MGRKNRYNKKQLGKVIDDKIDNKLMKLSELKYHLVSTGSLPVNPSFTLPTNLQPIHKVASGTGSNDRTGSKITPTSLQLRLTAYRGLADCTLRIIFLRYKELGYTRIGTGILDSSDDGTNNIVNAPYITDKSGRSRYEVLYDKRFTLDDAKQNSITLSDSVKMSKNILYDSTASTANQQNAIYMMLLSDSSLANAPDVRYTIYTRYRDM